MAVSVSVEVETGYPGDLGDALRDRCGKLTCLASARLLGFIGKLIGKLVRVRWR